MICTFFGHKDAPNNLKIALKNTIMRLIDVDGVKKFYVGNNGNFDYLVQCVLKEISAEKAGIDYGIVLSHIDEKVLSGAQQCSIFPEALENALPRYAISKRNDWMIQKCRFVIAYKKNGFSNTCKWIEKATRKGLKIINLSK